MNNETNTNSTEIAPAGVTNYWPEMQQSAPVAQCEIRPGGFSGKCRVWTRVELPAGRGVTFNGILTVAQLVPQAQHKAGMREYTLTDSALARLSKSFSFSRECLLD